MKNCLSIISPFLLALYFIACPAFIDTEEIRNTISQMDTMTIIGRYDFDKSGKQRRHFPMIIQWQNGKKKVVWSEGIKTADLIFK